MGKRISTIWQRFLQEDNRWKWRNELLLLVSAILMAISMFTFPVDFDSDSGIRYRRDYVLSATHVTLELHANDYNLVMPVKKVPIWPLRATALVAVLFCVYTMCSRKAKRMVFRVRITMGIEGLYYLMTIIFCIYLSDELTVSIRPSWGLVLPGLAMLCAQYIVLHWKPYHRR